MDTSSFQVVDLDQRVETLEIRSANGGESVQKIARLPALLPPRGAWLVMFPPKTAVCAVLGGN
jgi:hypothetical protein